MLECLSLSLPFYLPFCVSLPLSLPHPARVTTGTIALLNTMADAHNNMLEIIEQARQALEQVQFQA